MRFSTSIALLVVAAGGIASAQIYVPKEKVLSTSDNGGFVPISGSLNGTQTWRLGSGSAFQSTACSIDGNGNVAFSAVLTTGVGGVTGSANNYTYWYGGPGTLQLQARYGDPTLDNAFCGGAGAIFTSRASDRVPMSPNGFMWIGGFNISGGTVLTSGTSADNNVIWAGQAGAFKNLVRRQDVFLNEGGCVQNVGPTSASSQMARMNNLGMTCFFASLRTDVANDVPDTTTANNTFIGVATYGTDTANFQNGRVVKVVRKGDDVIGGGSQMFSFYDPQMNHSGAVFNVLGLTSGVGGVTGNDDWVLALSSNSGSGYTHTILGREGGPTGVGAFEYAAAPTIPGNPPFIPDTFVSPFVTVVRQGINNAGRVIWGANLKQGVAGVTASDDAALMTHKGGVKSIVFREGETLFGIGPIAFGVQSGNPVNNVTLTNSNQIAWIGQFVANGTTITTTNDQFLALSSVDDAGGVTHTLVAREGDQIPGMPAGVVWSQPFPCRGSDVFANVAANASGNIFFFARINGPGVVRDDCTTLGDDLCYWLYTPASCGKVRLVARRGDVLDGINITAAAANLDANSEGSSNCLNDEGWLGFTVYAAGSAADGAIYRSKICPADLSGAIDGEPDGGVDISDLLYFLGRFEAGNCAADIESGTNPGWGLPDGGVDINDLLYFLARFEAGC